jgi:ferrochelatase
MKTGRLLAERLNLRTRTVPDLLPVTLRQGRVAAALHRANPRRRSPRQGRRRVDVICPGFVADCLETLEEIAMEGKVSFLGHGGKEYHYIPALNENQGWLNALTSIVERHLVAGRNAGEGIDPDALAATARLAKTYGARS